MKPYFNNADKKRKRKLKPHFMPKSANTKSAIEGFLQLRGKFGFILSEDPSQSDVYISGANLSFAMDGDRVAARLLPGSKREGTIVRIIERARSTIVGIYRQEHDQFILQPDQQEAVIILDHNGLSPQIGQAVVARITRWPSAKLPTGGTLQEVLGWPQDAGVDVRILLKQREFRQDFPEAVLQHVQKLPSRVDDSSWQGRRTFFDIPVFTIDGADAKDFDDAVSLQDLPGGLYRLGVHIADVAQYVSLGSALDLEAAARATSIYPVGQVVPMLPHKLSEDLCSLKPNVERLTLSCLMDITPQGHVQNYEIVQGVICSTQRLTYTQAQDIIEGLHPQNTLTPILQRMHSLSRQLRQQRFKRGALDFTFPESQIILDASGKALDIVPGRSLPSHQLIEEFMLLANETVAQHLAQKNWPCLYRVHEKPDAEKLAKLVPTFKLFGIDLPKDFARGKRQSLAHIVAQLKDHPLQHLLGRLILRGLKQAVYMCENKGHFGLASACYTHFTSPIRRYPDLCVHRILKARLNEKPLSADQKSWEKTLPEVAQQCSRQERLAQEVEWASIDLKRVEFMQSKVGEVFTGIITSVVQFGFFVEINDYLVEGLVHVESLQDDYYIFDPAALTLRARRSHRTFKVGQSVRVQLVQANLSKRRLDFAIVEKK